MIWQLLTDVKCSNLCVLLCCLCFFYKFRKRNILLICIVCVHVSWNLIWQLLSGVEFSILFCVIIVFQLMLDLQGLYESIFVILHCFIMFCKHLCVSLWTVSSVWCYFIVCSVFDEFERTILFILYLFYMSLVNNNLTAVGRCQVFLLMCFTVGF